MELIERSTYLDALSNYYGQSKDGAGHTVFLTGEAGVGKTSLVTHFLASLDKNNRVYSGACDSLFTPRPLGPLYDMGGQIGIHFLDLLKNEKDRSIIFDAFLEALSSSALPKVLVIEDIHWADEATLDFIKFLTRRIIRFNCLFLLTYRDDEIQSGHPLSTFLGQLPSGNFSRLPVNRLSLQAVNRLALAKGYSTGESVYALTGGNAFYVTEILASYSPGIPERVKDAVLAVFHSKDQRMKALWELLSILPSRIEFSLAEKIEQEFPNGIDDCIRSGVIVSRQDYLSFKHELYRIAIEGSLSEYRRRSLHGKVLKLMLESTPGAYNHAQLLHHARYADDKELILKIAPQAAREAALLGAHIESSRLYLSAMENMDQNDPAMEELYEKHAYECYLTNQIKSAISSVTKALRFQEEKQEATRIGNSLRFLSRLYWFDGNGNQAESFAEKAIAVLEEQPSSKAKAMAYSNMSQLKMLSDQDEACLFWGEKAMAVAKEIGDEETLAHALNNVSSALIRTPSSEERGIALLNESLQIALRNEYHEHVARAYTNLGSNAVTIRNYALAREALDEGIRYCEERDLDSWTAYMLAWKARLNLETGNWNEAQRIADELLKNLIQPPVVKIGALVVAATVRMRRGEEARHLLLDANTCALETKELQRIVPVLLAMLEYEWITSESIVDVRAIQQTIDRMVELKKLNKKSRIYFWLRKVNKDHLLTGDTFVLKDQDEERREEISYWEQIGSPYESALIMFDGDEEEKREALVIIEKLDAPAVAEKMKSEMKAMGIKKIPRGQRESTKSNPANLTERQIEVLKLLRDGLQNKEIADKLFISPKTVDHHVSAILSQLGVASRAKAVLEAIRMEIME
jgi:DNA-binding CsgD family transcriptional regulator/tetratricopeptide (TPR) repeat protein/tRNA A37 threonylcarbamoyladenosine biosynthesis protein TsaE